MHKVLEILVVITLGLFISLVVIIKDAQAAGVYLHGLSYHSKYADVANQVNYGLGAYYDISDTMKVEAGVYKNSIYRTSHYIGIQHKLSEWHSIEVGLDYLLVTGYIKNIPVPVVSPYIESHRVRMLLIPDYRMVGVGFSLRLK